MDTAQKITQDLSDAEMSDADIAASVGSSQPTIWRIRTGETKSCASDLYIALASLRDSKKSGLETKIKPPTIKSATCAKCPDPDRRTGIKELGQIKRRERSTNGDV